MYELSATTLLAHVGHPVEIVTYGDEPVNVSLECSECSVVLADHDLVTFSINEERTKEIENKGDQAMTTEERESHEAQRLSWRPRSPWTLDADRISDEVSEKLNNGYWEDEESEAAKAASRLPDLPDGEIAKRLWLLWDTRDDLWDEFSRLENMLIDALVQLEGEVKP